MLSPHSHWSQSRDLVPGYNICFTNPPYNLLYLPHVSSGLVVIQRAVDTEGQSAKSNLIFKLWLGAIGCFGFFLSLQFSLCNSLSVLHLKPGPGQAINICFVQSYWGMGHTAGKGLQLRLDISNYFQFSLTISGSVRQSD